VLGGESGSRHRKQQAGGKRRNLKFCHGHPRGRQSLPSLIFAAPVRFTTAIESFVRDRIRRRKAAWMAALADLN
jgi:hypothetical protein